MGFCLSGRRAEVSLQRRGSAILAFERDGSDYKHGFFRAFDLLFAGPRMEMEWTCGSSSLRSVTDVYLHSVHLCLAVVVSLSIVLL